MPTSSYMTLAAMHWHRLALHCLLSNPLVCQRSWVSLSTEGMCSARPARYALFVLAVAQIVGLPLKLLCACLQLHAEGREAQQRVSIHKQRHSPFRYQSIAYAQYHHSKIVSSGTSQQLPSQSRPLTPGCTPAFSCAAALSLLLLSPLLLSCRHYFWQC